MSRNPRVNVSLKQNDYEVLARLSAANGSSMSAILAELWGMASPVMARVAVLLEEAAAAQQSVKEGIREATQAAALEIVPHAERAYLRFDVFEQAIRDVIAEARSSGPPSSNTGVRSSGLGGPGGVGTGVRSSDGRGVES